MAWPTNKPNSDKFSSDGDSIKNSRPELKTMSDAVNDIVDFIDTSNIQNNYILKYNSTSGALEFVAESGGGGGTTTVDINAGTGITVSSPDSAGGYTIATTALLNISEDTTPQLGGNLDAQSNNITNLGTLNTHTVPSGTGTLALTSDIPSSIDTQIVAGTGISVSQPDSGGAFTITNTSPGGGSISPLTADLDTKTFEIGNLTIDSAGESSPAAMNFGSGGGGNRVINMYNKDYGNLSLTLQNYDPGRANSDWGALQLKSYGPTKNATSIVEAGVDLAKLQYTKANAPIKTTEIRASENVMIDNSSSTNGDRDEAVVVKASTGLIRIASNDGVAIRNSYIAGSGQDIILTSKGTYLQSYKLVFPATLSSGPLSVTEVTSKDSAGDVIEQYDISVGLAGAGFTNGGIKSSNFTAVGGNSFIISASLTADLPASPSEGDRVEFVYITTGTVTVDRNGSNINGSATNLTNTTKGADCFVYTNATEGWRQIY